MLEVAEAALRSLLPKLGTLLTDEYKLHKGVKGEIKFLQAEMESMQVALQTVSKLPPQKIDDVIKSWARKLKDLCYDIEDSIDAHMVNGGASVHGKPKSFRKFFDRTIGLLSKAKTRHRIATEIEDIKRRIYHVSDQRQRYNFEDLQPATMAIDPVVTALYEDAANLVGIHGPTEKIIGFLTQVKDNVEQQKQKVVSIVGIGGLGKTTIANSVYQRLGKEFDCQAFISITLNPNMNKILSNILRQVTKAMCNNDEEKDSAELIRNIREFLSDKRYFIVIDDVWNKDAWKYIKCALIDNNLGSRVIVTTRNIDVAQLSSGYSAMYELEPLSEVDSKRLFNKRIFNGNGSRPELEEVSEKILKKCGGVPLAIITIASLLVTKSTKYDWYNVYNSIGCGGESMERVREILSLSYGDLPYHLKPCLLYLTMFPEDYEVEKDILVRMWVAEGFIHDNQGTNLYELGESYFNELVNRSMVQPIIDENGNARGCRVHDMILDLIISLSAEENFVTILSKYMQPAESSEFMIRRFSLQTREVSAKGYTEQESKKVQTTWPARINMSHVRSLIGVGDAFEWMPPLSRFSVLRVLMLECFPSRNSYPKDLGRLHHLRYLALRGQIETELLEQLGNLQLLQTLDFSSAYIQELPRSIVHLRQLEHLLVYAGVKFPDGIGNLSSLQELSWLDVQESPNSLAEIGNLNKLRVLSINGLDDNGSQMKTFLKSLSKLGNIRVLNFSLGGTCNLDCMSEPWKVPARLQSFYGGWVIFQKLPQWFSVLSELSRVSIIVNTLKHEDIELLGGLPVLRFLELQVAYDGTTEEKLVIDQPFDYLAEFKFEHFTRCWLVFAHGVMPRLRKLELSFQARKRGGVGFDIGLENLTSLSHITVKVDCREAHIRDVEDVEARIRDATESYPNHPTVAISREHVYEMARDESDDDCEDPEKQSWDLLAAEDESDNSLEASEQSLA